MKRNSGRFYSATASLHSYETRARRTLFALMKTLARNEEKRNQERETRNTRYAYGLWVRESLGILMLVRVVLNLTFYLNTVDDSMNGSEYSTCVWTNGFITLRSNSLTIQRGIVNDISRLSWLWRSSKAQSMTMYALYINIHLECKCIIPNC